MVPEPHSLSQQAWWRRLLPVQVPYGLAAVVLVGNHHRCQPSAWINDADQILVTLNR
jgi:hypothetical protein